MEVGKTLDDFILMGRYDLMAAIMIELVMLSQCGNLMFMVFAGAVPKVTGCIGGNTTGLSPEEICQLYDAGECHPITEYQFLSANVEFGILCGDTKEIKDSTSSQMIGYLIGSLIWGQISDVFGRKRPMFICLLLNGILGLATCLSPDLLTLTVIRTALAFFFTGHVVIVFVLFCETFPSKHRLWLAFVLNWSPNYALVAIIAYLCGNWRWFSLIINVLCFPAAFILWFMCETPHFLLRRGLLTKAAEAVARIYKINGHQLDEKALNAVFEHERKHLELLSHQSYSFAHLFCTKRLAGYTTAIFLSFLMASMVNYSLLFNMEEMNGSIYVNAFFMGFFRLVLNLVSALVDYKCEKLGRKTEHNFYCLYALVTFGAAIVAEFLGISSSESSVLRFILLSAASMVCQLYAVVGVVCNEVFPTPIRNVAFAMTQLSEAVASIAAPQVFQLTSFGQWVPHGVMIVLITADLLFFSKFVPESRGKPLAEDMPEEAERLGIFRKDFHFDIPHHFPHQWPFEMSKDREEEKKIFKRENLRATL
ncbi:unnamed protein product, partial [Mesorhabditis belari]|uniref:Major facilitator superfamily (MFS) profile domain-containing protein n=1 Tax=Mesorhabditis belari TaxID=2138241 RepID=A0AAF3FHR1_9BILA